MPTNRCLSLCLRLGVVGLLGSAEASLPPVTSPALAQIVPDATLGTAPSTVTHKIQDVHET